MSSEVGSVCVCVLRGCFYSQHALVQTCCFFLPVCVTYPSVVAGYSHSKNEVKGQGGRERERKRKNEYLDGWSFLLWMDGVSPRGWMEFHLVDGWSFPMWF